MKQAARPAPIMRLLRAPWLPFVVLWLFMAVCHLLFRMGTGDDAMYAQVIPTRGLWDYLTWAYANWSARSLIDIFLCLINYLPHLFWRLCNPLIITGCALAISHIVGARGLRGEATTNWVVCGLMLLYPWQVMDSAGWVSTTTVFLWPAAAALGALVPLAALCRGQKPRGWVAALSVLGLLYATNMEQLTILLLPLLAGLLVWLLATKRRVHWLLWAQLGAAAANAVWILLCPGTRLRFAGEVSSWFPNFGMKSLLSKLELGASAALDPLVYQRDLIFFFFCLLLAWCIFIRYKHILYRVLALVPLLVCMVLGMYQRYTLAVLPQLAFFTDALDGEGMITLANANSLTAYIPLVLLYLVFVVCLVNLYLALGHTPVALAAVWALCCGFASRLAIGFSPTIWTSGVRTGFFFSLTLLVLCALLYRQAALAPVTALPGAPAARAQKSRRVQQWVFGVVFACYCLLQMYSIQEIRIASGYAG